MAELAYRPIEEALSWGEPRCMDSRVALNRGGDMGTIILTGDGWKLRQSDAFIQNTDINIMVCCNSAGMTRICGVLIQRRDSEAL